MGIASRSQLAAANATYVALFQELWGKNTGPLLCDFATQVVPVDGTSLRIPVTTSFPRMRQWLGQKRFKDLRAFSQTIDINTYERSISLPRLDVDADKSGVVRSTLSAFLANGQMGKEDILITSLLANTWTSYDSVALLSNSHSFSNSTGDNLTTNALSFSEYRTVKEGMRDLTDEDGTPLNITPTHLIVGPAQERIALDVVNAQRVVAVSSAGALDATSSVVGAAAIPNVYQGDVTVVVSQWITGNQWFLMDLSKPGLRPFTCAMFRDVEPRVLDASSGETESRYFRDEYNYSLEGDFTYAAGLWQLIAGSVTA